MARGVPRVGRRNPLTGGVGAPPTVRESGPSEQFGRQPTKGRPAESPHDPHRSVSGADAPPHRAADLAAVTESAIETEELFVPPNPKVPAADVPLDLAAADESIAVTCGSLSFGVTQEARTARLEAQQEALFNNNDRIQVTDTRPYPYRCICHLLCEFQNPAGEIIRGTGTGWVVGRRTIITAGHCVFIFKATDARYSSFNQTWAAQVRVIPGRNGDLRPFGEYIVGRRNLRSTADWTERGSEVADYGAILLDEDLPADFGAFGFGVLPDSGPDGLAGLRANVVGYPGEFKEPPHVGTLWGDNSPRLPVPGPQQLRYQIDTTPGQSGSPVFFVRKQEKDAIAVGIHNYGVQGVTNFATRVTPAVRDRLKAWREEGEKGSGGTDD